MKNYAQRGDVLTLIPTAAVPSGTGYLAGVLFGVATVDVAANAPGEFATEGVVTLAKTSALAIAAGDRLFWDPVAKAVNKTLAGQQCIGVATTDAANPSATVTCKLGPYVALAA